MPTKTYTLERLTKEELEVAIKAVQEIREENARLERIKQAKEILNAGISMMIDLVGIETTKTILREKNRELRE